MPKGPASSLSQLPYGVRFIFNISVGWSFYPQFYNTVYTDFFPPARGVQRRITEE